MASSDDEHGFDRRTGRAKYYSDENNQLVPVKETGFSTFLTFLLFSVFGLAVTILSVTGSWWLHLLGIVMVIVGLVGTNNYKWRTYYWDTLALLISVLSIYLHLKQSNGQ